MTRISFLIALFVLANSAEQKIPQKELKKKLFDVATESLNPLPDGFSVLGNDISKFARRIFDTESDLIANPLLKPVTDSALVLLSGKYPTDTSRSYYFTNKMKVGSHVLLTLMQFDKSGNEYWMNFNLFSSSGQILDTLKFAGQKLGFYEMFGIIDKNLNIETNSYFDIEIDNTNPDKYHYRYFATEVKKRYVIQDTCFKLVETLKERTLFTDVSDRKIVARVDTLKFHY